MYVFLELLYITANQSANQSVNTMPTLTLEEFLALSEQVAFGHSQYPFASASDRLLLISNRIASHEEWHNGAFKVIVADQTERDLLLGDMKSRHPESIDGSLSIHHYAELLLDMRQGNWDWSAISSMVIFCQVDLHYNAGFPIFMAQLLRWAQQPTSHTRLRVLTMSEFEAPEKPLCNLLDTLAPEFPEMYMVKLNTGIQRPQRPRPSSWSGDFVQSAASQLTTLLQSGGAALVQCSPAEANNIKSSLASTAPSYTALSNALHDVPALLAVSRETNPPRPVIVFLCESSRVPIPIPNLRLVLASGTRQAARWNKGRVVLADEDTSVYEMTCLRIEAMQHNAASDIEVVMPQQSSTRKYSPRRRIDHEQSWGFIASVALEFSAPDTAQILSFFMTNGITVRSVISHLYGLKCFRLSEESTAEQLPFNDRATSQLAILLPQVGYNLHIAWFLALAVVSDHATTAAKRAVMHMVALASIRFMLPDDGCAQTQPYLWPWNAATDTMKPASRFAVALVMPQRMQNEGSLWIALDLWHSFGDSECTMELSKYKLVHDTLTGFTSSTALGLLPHSQPLELEEDDIRCIQYLMIEAFMHRSIAIGQPLTVDQPPEVTDLVARGGVEGVMRIDGQALDVTKVAWERGFMIVASLRMELVNGSVIVNDIVVLPMQAVAQWQQNRNSSFVEVVAYEFVY